MRAYVEEDALPAEAEIADPADLLPSWPVVERLRDRARERGLYTPHLPEEWGGLGIGPLGMALDLAGVRRLRAGLARPQRDGARRGQHAHAADRGHADQLETYLRPLAEGRTAPASR